jgi:RNA polymerase sigma factor (sigma-70 family)
LHATSCCAACVAHASRRPRARVEASARKRLEVDAIELCAASVAALEELEAEAPMRLLLELPPHQREAVQARVLEDLDYRELAARLQVSPVVARQRVSRGLRTLRRRIQHEGVDR